MPATMEIIRPSEIDQWDQALYAFLAEKERRSGSRRTVESYSRMLQHFFALVAKTPEKITSPEVFGRAHWDRALGPAALVDHDRRPTGVPLFLL